MEIKENNIDLHFEHSLWQKELLFWEDEIKSFQNRLDEIQKRWTDKVVLAKVDHFQNQFIIHKEKINELQDILEQQEYNLAIQAKKHPEVISIEGHRVHLQIRDSIEIQRQLYIDIKKQFFIFLSKYL